MTYESEKVWSVLLRLFHWAFALSTVALVVSGFYIHEPWVNSMLEGSRSFPMAFARYVHFIAGFVFTGAMIVRIYLWFFGNKYEKILDFAPVTPRNIRNFFSTIGYYLYIYRPKEHRMGHNAFAGFSYIITMFIAVGQFLSGFYLLYPESQMWQSLGLKLFGTQQEARMIHHVIMWYFMWFVLVHLYIFIWNDIRSPEGLISSIFNGTKFKPKKVS